jgi:hypothetical protein
LKTRSVFYRGRSITDAFRQSVNHQTKGNPMRPVIRYQSQLLFRKSYKPNRIIRIRPGVKQNLVFRPSRAGPVIKRYECKTD